MGGFVVVFFSPFLLGAELSPCSTYMHDPATIVIFGSINVNSPNLKSGFSLWDLIKGKYFFLLDLLNRTYDACLYGLGWFFVCFVVCFLLNPQVVFVYEAFC